MKLEQQVVSLELAKKLKELGVKQDGVYYWVIIPEKVNQYTQRPVEHRLIPAKALKGYPYELYSAFTVAELLNMLQELIKSDILIPLNIKVADCLATELVKEYEERESKR